MLSALQSASVLSVPGASVELSGLSVASIERAGSLLSDNSERGGVLLVCVDQPERQQCANLFYSVDAVHTHMLNA